MERRGRTWWLDQRFGPVVVFDGMSACQRRRKYNEDFAKFGHHRGLWLEDFGGAPTAPPGKEMSVKPIGDVDQLVIEPVSVTD